MSLKGLLVQTQSPRKKSHQGPHRGNESVAQGGQVHLELTTELGSIDHLIPFASMKQARSDAKQEVPQEDTV